MDTKKSGTLGRKELLKQTSHEGGINISQEVKNFIETSEKNKDGKISREEWKDYHIQLFDDRIKKDLDKHQKPSK